MSDNKDYVITLDNNKKYVLVNMVTYNEKKYAYLSELADFSKYIIGEVINDEIVEVEDKNLIGQLILEFSKLK